MSILIVLAFAAIQYQIVQKVIFDPVNYIIPFIVGIMFGYFISFIQQLKKRYQAEKEMVVEKNKMIHSYLGTIVHDLRSPVSAIYSLNELIQRNRRNLSPDQITYLNMIHTSAASILENIELILDNTKMEQGRGPDHLETGNPYFTINAIIDKHLVFAIQKSISIQRLIDKNLPAVKYDKNILDRVVSNLISNAIKYSPQNTQIKVYTELFSDKLDLVVKDEGLGMTEEDMGKLFGEFQRLSAKPTAGESSSGLGLFVSKKLVKQMGGEIYAESAGKNQGSTFKLELKLDQQ